MRLLKETNIGKINNIYVLTYLHVHIHIYTNKKS